MKKFFQKGILAGLLILSLLLVTAGSAAAAPADPSNDTISVTVPFFEIYSRQNVFWDFPYSDDYFRKPSGSFNRELAKASMGLMVSAFRNNASDLPDQYETYLKGAGFQDIYGFGFGEPTSKDTLAAVMGWKQVDDYILIAAAPSGQGYQKEWAGNLEVGDEERHVGFNNAAQLLEGQINDYMETHNLTGKCKLWLTGFSRSSAVANLTAADMIDSGKFEDVYAYLFAVPRTTRAENCFEYSGIFNICGKSDIVTQIPPQSWNYFRYGTDLYTPAPEMDSLYMLSWNSAFQVFQEATNGGIMYYNAEVNHQLHLIIEFLVEMFPTSGDYYTRFQDIIMNFWNEADPDRMLLILAAAVEAMENLDAREASASDTFVDYITYIASQHLTEQQKQVLRGDWDPEASIAMNVLREHCPITYLSWVFSDLDAETLYQGPDLSQKIYIIGDADVEVYKNGLLIIGIDQNGEPIYLTDSLDGLTLEELVSNVFLVRNGKETLTSIPYDADYTLRIRTKDTENIIIYDYFYTPYMTDGYGDSMIYSTLEAGEYELLLDPLSERPLSEITALSGNVVRSYTSDFDYSPTVIMATESGSSDHLTIPTLFALIIGLAIFTTALLLVCLIIFIVHTVRAKKRNKPYSSWVVIIPHGILILVFTLLTQFFTDALFAIRYARLIPAGITMLVIFLLALRGTIRNRCPRNLIVLGIVLALGIVNVLIYQPGPFASAVLWKFLIYALCIALITILAASTFFHRHRKDAGAAEEKAPEVQQEN